MPSLKVFYQAIQGGFHLLTGFISSFSDSFSERFYPLASIFWEIFNPT